MNVVFCVDRSALSGLHVAAFSLLARIRPDVTLTHIDIFSDELDDDDMGLLEQTLRSANRPFELSLRRINPTIFKAFPLLNRSWATYYRLLVPENVEFDRYLYLDVDTLCDVNVSELESLPMNGSAVALSPESPLSGAVDRHTAERLGNSHTECYFNAGVMLINVPEWKRQHVTDRTVEYIIAYRPLFHDQAALNYVMHGAAISLDPKFNCIANMRKNWPVVTRPFGQIGRLVHFVGYPKPWDLGAECLHPQYRLWHSVLRQTAFAEFHSWHNTPARKWPRTRAAWSGYKKAFKDRLLFSAYQHGWLKRPKGVSSIS